MADSLANIVAKMELVLGTEPASPRIDLYRDHFRSVSIVVADGPVTGELVLFDPDPIDVGGVPRLEPLLFVLGSDFVVEMQWWYASDEQAGSPTYKMNIVGIETTLENLGTTYTLQLATAGTFDAYSGAPASLASFPAGMRISDVASQIAAYYGWPTTSPQTARPTIEPTTSALSQGVVVSNENHFSFILNVLVPMATGATGNTYVCYFDADGSFHFHSRGWITAATFSYNFRDLRGDVQSLSITNNKVYTQFTGGGDAKYVAPDSLKGVFTESVSTERGGLVGGDDNRLSTAVSYGDAVYFTPASARQLRRSVAARDPATMNALAKALYAQLDESAFYADLSVRGNHHIYVGMYIDLRRQRLGGAIHPASGSYNVRHVTQDFRPGRWSTVIAATRGAMSKPDASPVMPGDDRLGANGTVTNAQTGDVPNPTSTSVPFVIGDTDSYHIRPPTNAGTGSVRKDAKPLG